MVALSNALAFAMAYLGNADRETSADADNDVKALEDIAALLADVSLVEAKALADAAWRAIKVEQQASSPNQSLMEGYQSVIEHLAEAES
jgi:hypothetical protein